MEDRVKPLQGVRNFRDFGGYETSDGARVKRDLLFRAGHFHEATDEDVDFINGLGIDFQVDLRRTKERTKQPNRWIPSEVHAFDDNETRGAAHIEYLKQGNVSAQASHAYMADYYRNAPYVDSHVDLYTRWFRRLAEVKGGALINCAAGKDRTGIACALTLTLLGVPEDVVIQDYELTNTAVDMEKQLPTVRATMEAHLGHSMDDEALRPFLGVHPDYLHNCFVVLREKHGAPETYARDVLGVDDALLAQIKARLLD